MKLDEIRTAALKLDEDERWRLVDSLFESLPAGEPNDSDEDSLTEAIRRGEELRSGKVEGIPKDEFLAEFRAERRVGRST